MTSFKTLLLTAAFICTAGKITFAQPGQLDPSFGNQGFVKTDMGLAF